MCFYLRCMLKHYRLTLKKVWDDLKKLWKNSSVALHSYSIFQSFKLPINVQIVNRNTLTSLIKNVLHFFYVTMLSKQFLGRGNHKITVRALINKGTVFLFSESKQKQWVTLQWSSIHPVEGGVKIPLVASYYRTNNKFQLFRPLVLA